MIKPPAPFKRVRNTQKSMDLRAAIAEEAAKLIDPKVVRSFIQTRMYANRIHRMTGQLQTELKSLPTITDEEYEAATVSNAAQTQIDAASAAAALTNAEPDDLTEITGIGPLTAAKLNAAGIINFAQMAAWTVGEARLIDAVYKLRGDPFDWVDDAQAILAARGPAPVPAPDFSRYSKHPLALDPMPEVTITTEPFEDEPEEGAPDETEEETQSVADEEAQHEVEMDEADEELRQIENEEEGDAPEEDEL